LITLKLRTEAAATDPPRMEADVPVLLFIVIALLPVVVRFVPVVVSQTVPVPVVVMLPVEPKVIDLVPVPDEMNVPQVSEFPFRLRVPPAKRYWPVIVRE
jgi:hypothetical protein